MAAGREHMAGEGTSAISYSLAALIGASDIAHVQMQGYKGCRPRFLFCSSFGIELRRSTYSVLCVFLFTYMLSLSPHPNDPQRNIDETWWMGSVTPKIQNKPDGTRDG